MTQIAGGGCVHVRHVIALCQTAVNVLRRNMLLLALITHWIKGHTPYLVMSNDTFLHTEKNGCTAATQPSFITHHFFVDAPKRVNGTKGLEPRWRLCDAALRHAG